MVITRWCDVCYWHKADVPLALTNVCFGGKNGHDAGVTPFPLMTQSGHFVSSMLIGWKGARPRAAAQGPPNMWHVISTSCGSSVLPGFFLTFFRTQCEGRLAQEQLARGEAPYGGTVFRGFVGGVGLGRRPFLSCHPGSVTKTYANS